MPKGRVKNSFLDHEQPCESIFEICFFVCSSVTQNCENRDGHGKVNDTEANPNA